MTADDRTPDLRWGFALLVMILPALIVFKDGPHAFYGSDGGACYLQARLLAETGDVELPIRPALAPVLYEFFPFRYAKVPDGPVTDMVWYQGASLVHAGGDRFRLVYPIGFAAMNAAAWRLFSEWGVHVPPLVAGLLIALSTIPLARRFGVQRPGMAAAFAVLATPVGFYVTVLWGHAPAAAAATLALALLVSDRGDPTIDWGPALTAGLALGTGGAMRNEGILFAGLVVVCFGVFSVRPNRPKALAIAGGVLIGLAPMLLFNWVRFGSPADPAQASRTTQMRNVVAVAGGPQERPLDRVRRRGVGVAKAVHEVLTVCDNFTPGFQVFATTGVLIAFALTILGMRAAQLERDGSLYARGAVLVLVPVMGLVLLIGAVVRPFQVPGILLCSPILIPGFLWLISPLAWGGDGRDRWVAAAALLFLGGCAVRGSAQLQWGGRYQVLLQPLLTVVAVAVFERIERASARPRALRRLAVIPVVYALIMTGFSYRERPWHSTPEGAEGVEILTSRATQAYVYDHWWFAWCHTPLWFDAEFFFLADPDRFGRLFRHFDAVGFDRVTLVSRRRGDEFEAYRRAVEAPGWRVAGAVDRVPRPGEEWHVLFMERTSP